MGEKESDFGAADQGKETLLAEVPRGHQLGCSGVTLGEGTAKLTLCWDEEGADTPLCRESFLSH